MADIQMHVWRLRRCLQPTDNAQSNRGRFLCAAGIALLLIFILWTPRGVANVFSEKLELDVSPLDKQQCKFQSPHTLVQQGARGQLPRIHVFVPNFYNAELAIANLRNLKARQNINKGVVYTVVTMEDAKYDRDAAALNIMHAFPDVHVLDLPQPDVAGGSALPTFFNFVLGHTRCEITVFADTDAFVLADGWDSRLVELFSDPSLALAAINPRVTAPQFIDNAEWNWMALRTSLYCEGSCFKSVEHLYNLHDWGHLFSNHAKRLNMRQHLWASNVWPLIKSVIVVGDSVDEAFAMHTFYASRRNKELLTEKAKDYILDDVEFAAVQEWAQGRVHTQSRFESILAAQRAMALHGVQADDP